VKRRQITLPAVDCLGS